MYRNILIPTDGTDLSQKAVSQGVALAAALGAGVVFVNVRRPFHSGDPEAMVPVPGEYRNFVHDYLTGESDRILSTAEAAARSANVECAAICVEHDHVYQGIIDTATERSCDLIVMASHGRSGLSAVVLGSEALKVLTHSPVPVLVCR